MYPQQFPHSFHHPKTSCPDRICGHLSMPYCAAKKTVIELSLFIAASFLLMICRNPTAFIYPTHPKPPYLPRTKTLHGQPQNLARSGCRPSYGFLANIRARRHRCLARRLCGPGLNSNIPYKQNKRIIRAEARVLQIRFSVDNNSKSNRMGMTLIMPRYDIFLRLRYAGSCRILLVNHMSKFRI